MQLSTYLSTTYLFDINRVMLQQSDKVFLALGVVLAVVGLVFGLAARYAPTPVDRSYRRRLYHCFLATGLFEIVWFGARAEYVSFFGSHFVALLLGAAGIAWLAFIVADMAKRYRPLKQEWEKEQVRLKYLPK